MVCREVCRVLSTSAATESPGAVCGEEIDKSEFSLFAVLSLR